MLVLNLPKKLVKYIKQAELPEPQHLIGCKLQQLIRAWKLHIVSVSNSSPLNLHLITWSATINQLTLSRAGHLPANQSQR